MKYFVNVYVTIPIEVEAENEAIAWQYGLDNWEKYIDQADNFDAEVFEE